jgi:formate C-acetyltransferase
MAWAFQAALEDAFAAADPTLELLWERFAAHLRVMVDCIKEGYDYHYENVSKIAPEMVLNLFSHGPIERGVNAAAGGVDILNLNMVAVLI